MGIDVMGKVGEATELLDRVKKNLSHQKLNFYKVASVIFIVADMILFGWAIKNRFWLYTLFIVGLVFLIVFFALDYYFFPPEIKDLPKTDNKPKKENKKKEEKKEGFIENLGINEDYFKNMDLGLPDADEYNKRASKAILGK